MGSMYTKIRIQDRLAWALLKVTQKFMKHFVLKDKTELAK